MSQSIQHKVRLCLCNTVRLCVYSTVKLRVYSSQSQTMCLFNTKSNCVSIPHKVRLCVYSSQSQIMCLFLTKSDYVSIQHTILTYTTCSRAPFGGNVQKSPRRTLDFSMVPVRKRSQGLLSDRSGGLERSPACNPPPPPHTTPLLPSTLSPPHPRALNKPLWPCNPIIADIDGSDHVASLISLLDILPDIIFWLSH